MTRPILCSCVMFAMACGASPAPPPATAPTQTANDAVNDTPNAAQPAAAAQPTAASEPAVQDAPMSLEAPADVAAPPPGAEVTASGLASRVLRAGTGTDHPAATNRVTVHYTGWTTDGKRFDSSVARNSPATFPLDGVIAGWTEGVQLMVVGERRRFWIPGGLAYDNSSRADAPKGMLVFDVELISIE